MKNFGKLLKCRMNSEKEFFMEIYSTETNFKIIFQKFLEKFKIFGNILIKVIYL